MDDPAFFIDIANTQPHGMKMLREAEAYVTQLSGLKTETTDFDFKFVRDKNDDAIGIEFIITLAFSEENANG